MTAERWSDCAELALCVLAGWRLVCLRPCVQDTTLVDAWRWACGVVLAAASVAATRMAAESVGRSFAAGDCLLAAIGLTPLVAVLGARRPTNRVWAPFIVVPLLVVLNWPVWWLVLSRGWWGDLALETPATAAFALVAIMACGNYLGTRLMFAAFAWGIALLVLVLCHTAGWKTCLRAEWVRLGLGVVGSIGLFRIGAVWNGLAPVADRFDRVWFEFLDRFGVVWARRIQERLNALARQQNWPGKLELDGWHWTLPLDLNQQQQLEHACRWLLRRFVDAEWLDRRLGTSDTDFSPLGLDS